MSMQSWGYCERVSYVPLKLIERIRADLLEVLIDSSYNQLVERCANDKNNERTYGHLDHPQSLVVEAGLCRMSVTWDTYG